MYLLDTHVISELRKARNGKADSGVVTWAGSIASQNLFMSAISLLELESGVAALERKDRIQAATLRTWLDDQVMKAFEGRILSVDAAVARKRSSLPFTDPKHDRDALMAATALTHGLTLATRNPAAYKSCRVKLFNPWGYAPEADEDNGDWQQVAKAGPLWLKNLFLRF